MNKRLVLVTITLVVLLFSGLQYKLHTSKSAVPAFSKTDVHYGAEGGDVYELQGRLKFLGFYTGKVDGDFGYHTLKSVKWFQSEFGLKIDGIVGIKTKTKLWAATKSWKPGGTGTPAATGVTGTAPKPAATSSAVPASSRRGLSDNDLKIMANAVYGESRGEPFIGQVAVAAVILNRLEDPNFPHTISGVIFQPGAFTAVADGQIWLTPNETAKRAVQLALDGMDPTGHCIYYFNPKTATSKWIWGRPQVKTIGQHIFCK